MYLFPVGTNSKQNKTPGEGTPRKIGWGVRPDCQNPYPIYDQKSAIFPTIFMTWPLHQNPVSDLRYNQFTSPKRLNATPEKRIPSMAALTYVAHIREYPSGLLLTAEIYLSLPWNETVGQAAFISNSRIFENHSAGLTKYWTGFLVWWNKYILAVKVDESWQPDKL